MRPTLASLTYLKGGTEDPGDKNTEKATRVPNSTEYVQTQKASKATALGIQAWWRHTCYPRTPGAEAGRLIPRPAWGCRTRWYLKNRIYTNSESNWTKKQPNIHRRWEEKAALPENSFVLFCFCFVLLMTQPKALCTHARQEVQHWSCIPGLTAISYLKVPIFGNQPWTISS